MCKCNFGTSPDYLKVHTQQHEYANDKEGSLKYIASTKDIGSTLQQNSFGSCAKQKNNPCMAVITEWKGPYEHMTLENGGKVLLEDSTATCPIGGSGCIKIVKHGQTAEPGSQNFKNAEPKVSKTLNPAVDPRELTEEPVSIEGLSVGERYYKGSSNNGVIAVTADVAHAFEVTEWLPGTTDAQKNDTSWLFEDAKRTKVLTSTKTGGPSLRAFAVPKKLCGSVPMYYLEASLSGLMEKSINAGLLVRGICGPLIVKSNWSKSYKGAPLGTSPIRFGDDVHLHVETEGLNGNRLTVQIFRRKWFTDEPVDTLYNVLCENGEINYLIRNTYKWHAELKSGPSEQELYIKIIDNHTKTYVKDSRNQDLHARFLRLENKVVTSAMAQSTNLTVATVGEPLKNLKQPDHCKFTKIEISDLGERVPVFDEGKIDAKGQITESKFYIDEKINYDFDAYKVRDVDKKKLDKIAEVLMKIPYIPVELGSHTDRFGTAEYNLQLSEKRAKAAMDYLISRNVDASRIVSKGYGKTMLANPDPNLDKKESLVNRRTTIKLLIFTHNALSMQYETIAPGLSKARELPIQIANFKTAGLCNFPSNPHQVNVPYGNLVQKKEKTPLQLDGKETIHPKIYSPLDDKEHAYEYIWPMSTTYNSFFFYINSCAYFTNRDKHSLVVKAYSDIKWRLTFFLKLNNALSVKWQNLSPAEHKEMQKKAGKEGAERRWKQKDATFGFSLTSDWNSQKGAYTAHDEFKKEHEGKFKKLYDLFSSLNSIADGITNVTKGTVRGIGFDKLPVKFEVEPPNLDLDATWMLQRAKKDRAPIARVGTRIDIGFHAQPLIGLEVTIDLLGALIGAAAGAVSGGTASQPVLKFYYLLKDKLKTGLKLGNDDVGFKANADIFMNLKIFSRISTDVGFGFNTVSGREDDTFKIEAKNKLGVVLEAGVIIKGELAMVVVKVDGYFEASASARASVTFGHGVYYDDKGLYYKPKLGFDGMDADYVITASVGLAAKKGVPAAEVIKDKKGDWVIAKGDFKGIIPKFDVIESLEEKAILLVALALMNFSCKNTKPAGFDLANINGQVSITQVMEQTGLKLENGKSGAMTLSGYKIFESSDPKILKFGDAELAGKGTDSVNKVLIHYSVKDNTIHLVELRLFSEGQVKLLTAAMDQKLGKAPYPQDAYTTVFNKNIRYFERTWLDVEHSMAYFLTVSLNPQDKEEARLAMVNYTDKPMAQLTSLKNYTPDVGFMIEKVTAAMEQKANK
eukprot:gene4750-5537_t